MASHTVTGKVASCGKFADVLYTLNLIFVGILFIFFQIFFVIEEIFSFYKTAKICSLRMWLSVCPSVHRSVSPLVRWSGGPLVCWFVSLSVCPSVHPSICPSVRPSILPSNHPSRITNSHLKVIAFALLNLPSCTWLMLLCIWPCYCTSSGQGWCWKQHTARWLGVFRNRATPLSKSMFYGSIWVPDMPQK